MSSDRCPLSLSVRNCEAFPLVPLSIRKCVIVPSFLTLSSPLPLNFAFLNLGHKFESYLLVPLSAHPYLPKSLFVTLTSSTTFNFAFLNFSLPFLYTICFIFSLRCRLHPHSRLCLLFSLKMLLKYDMSKKDGHHQDYITMMGISLSVST